MKSCKGRRRALYRIAGCPWQPLLSPMSHIDPSYVYVYSVRVHALIPNDLSHATKKADGELFASSITAVRDKPNQKNLERLSPKSALQFATCSAQINTQYTPGRLPVSVVRHICSTDVLLRSSFGCSYYMPHLFFPFGSKHFDWKPRQQKVRRIDSSSVRMTSAVSVLKQATNEQHDVKSKDPPPPSTL